MKKFLVVALILNVSVLSAQTVTRKIALNKGQQLEQQSHVKVTMTQEAMGQSMEIKMEGDITNLVEIKNAASNSFDVASTLKKVLMNMSAMGQDVKFDSDKANHRARKLRTKYNFPYYRHMGMDYIGSRSNCSN